MLNVPIFREGPLKYETDLYEFAKKIFHENLHRYGVKRSV